MTYPAIVIATAIIVFIIIMVVAVPMFIDTFEELNIELPAITKAMIALSRALTGYWWLLAILLFAGCGIYLYASRTRAGQTCHRALQADQSAAQETQRAERGVAVCEHDVDDAGIGSADHAGAGYHRIGRDELRVRACGAQGQGGRRAGQEYGGMYG